MMQIGAFRAWILEKIKTFKNVEWFTHDYKKGYERAMKDVAQYMDFPLDEEAWERW